MKRMVENLHRLRIFRSAHPRACSVFPLPPIHEPVSDLFFSGRLLRNVLVTPSFLVPAILDALRSSPRYRDLVVPVAGEADAYCALYLSKHGGTVITSDSDLLVHDVGNGRARFFRNIELDGDENIAGLTFCPRKISERLGLSETSLCRLAYELEGDSYAQLPLLMRRCLEDIKDMDDYRTFCHEYLHHEVPLPTSFESQLIPTDSLDPRLSELILQFGEQDNDEDFLEKKFFLPILVEDLERGTAWEQSTPVRQLAYTIARWLIPGASSSVQEYRRVNTIEQRGREIPLMSIDEAKYFASMVIDFGYRLRKETNDDPGLFWKMLCLALDINECSEQDRKCYVLHILQNPADSAPRKPGKVSWDIIHFTAQLQAGYYSFRILNQILQLTPSTLDEGTMITELRDLLSTFPPLTQFPDITQVVQFLHDSNGLRVLETLARVVNIPAKLEESSPPSSPDRSTQEVANPKRGLAAGPKTQTSWNMFDVLSED